MERLPYFPYTGIYFDKELPGINIRGRIDFGGRTLSVTQLDPRGTLQFETKGLCQIVPMNCVNGIEVEAEMKRSPPHIYQASICLGTELDVECLFVVVPVTLSHQRADHDSRRPLGFLFPRYDAAGDLAFWCRLGFSNKVRGRGHRFGFPDELLEVGPESFRIAPTPRYENPAFRRNNEF